LIDYIFANYFKGVSDMQEKFMCAIYTKVSTDNQLEIDFNSCEAQDEKVKSIY
jgi:hypothetical protein